MAGLLLLLTSCSAGPFLGAAVVPQQTTTAAVTVPTPSATATSIAAPVPALACVTKAPADLPWSTVFDTTPLASIDPGTAYTGRVATPKQSGNVVFSGPTTCSTPVAALPQQTLDAATTLPVIGEQAGWLNVLLPSRRYRPSSGMAPESVNHASGWIPAAAVELRAAPLEIAVDLGAGTVTLLNAGQEAYRTDIEMTGGGDTVLGRTFVTGVYTTPMSKQCSSEPMIVTAHQSTSMDEYIEGDGAAVQALHGFREACKMTLPAGVTPGCIIISEPAARRLLELGVRPGAVVTIR